jgi:hypothetical protein
VAASIFTGAPWLSRTPDGVTAMLARIDTSDNWKNPRVSFAFLESARHEFAAY